MIDRRMIIIYGTSALIAVLGFIPASILGGVMAMMSGILELGLIFSIVGIATLGVIIGMVAVHISETIPRYEPRSPGTGAGSPVQKKYVRSKPPVRRPPVR